MIPISFIWVFVITIAIGVPIVFSLSLAPIFGFLAADKAFFLKTLPQKLYIGINQLLYLHHQCTNHLLPHIGQRRT